MSKDKITTFVVPAPTTKTPEKITTSKPNPLKTITTTSIPTQLRFNYDSQKGSGGNSGTNNGNE